jgi:phosphate ABC transporter permease protein PstC/phosphate ABC transporter phosphate-binding protein
VYRNVFARRALAGAAIAALALTAACGDGAAGDPTDPGGGNDNGGDGLTGQINGAGATFPNPLWQTFIDEYGDVEPGVRINYQSIGSGGGITQFLEQTVDWGSSERYLSDAELADAEANRGCPAFQVPVVYGSVVIVFNDPDLDGLVLDAETIALIYHGEIRNYNDPAIQALNPDRDLPDQEIVPVRRSDGSGTTNVFTLYLEDEVPLWAEEYGSGTEVDWAGVALGGDGNEGVTAGVQQEPGGLGYVNQSYALVNDLPQAQVINADGNPIYPTLEATSAGLDGLDIPASYQFSILGIGGEGYPITGAVWNFFYECGYSGNTAEILRSFWTWATTEGDEFALELSYAPLGQAVKDRVLAELDRIGALDEQPGAAGWLAKRRPPRIPVIRGGSTLTVQTDETRSKLIGSRRGRLADPLFKAAVTTTGVLVLFLLGIMVVRTTIDAWPVFQKEGFFGFLSGEQWTAGHSSSREIADWTGTYGALPFVYGTLYVAIIALVIALPLALAVALFITQLAPRRFRNTLSYWVETLAAVPSIVYGLWGMLWFAPVVLRPYVLDPLNEWLGFIFLFEGPVRNRGYLTAGIVLAIMVLPIMTAIFREVFAAAPADELHAAYGLGATRWEVIRKVLLPRSYSGIVGGSMLGLGRAIGETIAVVMLVGSTQRMGASVFFGGDTMAAHIASTFQDAFPETVIGLMAIGVALFIFTFLINVLARLLVWRVGRLTGDSAV